MNQPDNFLFSEWYKARRKLAKDLDLTPRQHRILDEWFKAHIFEFGQEYKVDPYEVACLAKDNDRCNSFLKHVREKMLYNIASAALEKGLVVQQKVDDYSFFNQPLSPTRAVIAGWQLRSRILICGTPKEIGPAQFTKEKP